MDFSEVIKNRRSIRKFTSDSIPDEVLNRIMKQTRLSPTWANKQGVRYVIVEDPEILLKVGEATDQKWVKGAPMLIVVCISPATSGKNANGLQYFPVDAAICLTQLILSATNEGLGTCWMGWFNEDKIKAILEIPKKIRVIGLTPLGYPNYTPRAQERKNIEETWFKNGWKNPL